jgi:hypothetical protein
MSLALHALVFIGDSEHLHAARDKSDTPARAHAVTVVYSRPHELYRALRRALTA